MLTWLPTAERIPTAAYWQDGDFTGRAIMHHVMQGWRRTMDDWARQRPPRVKKSAHFGVDRRGGKAQYVSIDDKSWAAGAPCNPTWDGLPGGYTGSVNHLVYNIECEGFSQVPRYAPTARPYSPTFPWPEPLVEAVIEIDTWICDVKGIEPSAATLIRHSDTDTCTRGNDPGAYFPLDPRIVAAVRSNLGVDAPAPPPAPPSEHGHPDLAPLTVVEAADTNLRADLEAHLAKHREVGAGW